MFLKLCMQCLLLVVAQIIKLLLLEGWGVLSVPYTPWEALQRRA